MRRSRKARGLGRAEAEHARRFEQHFAQAQAALATVEDAFATAKCPVIWARLKEAVDQWSAGSANIHPGAVPQGFLDVRDATVAAAERAARVCTRPPLADQGGPDPQVERFRLLDLDGDTKYHNHQIDMHSETAGRVILLAEGALDQGECASAAIDVLSVRNLWKMAATNAPRPRGATKEKIQALQNKATTINDRFEATCLRRGHPERPVAADADPASTRFALLDLDGARRLRRRGRRRR